MHPGISEVPSTWFYASRLKDGVAAADKPPPKGIPWPVAGLPVAFIPVEDGVEERANLAGGDSGVDAVEEGPHKSKAARGGRAGGKGGKDDVSGGGGGGGDGVSFRNGAEARVALRATYALLKAGDVESAAVSATVPPPLPYRLARLLGDALWEFQAFMYNAIAFEVGVTGMS